MDFQSEGTTRSVNLSNFLLQSLKAERCDFLGEHWSGAGALSKQGFLPCPSILRNSKEPRGGGEGHLGIFWVGMCRP